MNDIATTPTEVTIPPTPVKAGIYTSEFWLGLAAKLLGGAYATGLIGDGTTAARIAGLAVVVLAYFGYTVSRGLVKSAAAGNGNAIAAFDPIVATSSTSAEAKSAAGAVPLLMLVLLLGAAGGALTSCTAAQRTTAVHSLWDCTSPQRAEFVAAAKPLADSAIDKATNPDGTLDDAAIKALFAPANLKTEAGTVIACLAIETLAARAAATPALSARVATAAPPLGVSAQAALDALRAAQFPGASFKTPAGVR
jgi:hypothetical protein